PGSPPCLAIVPVSRHFPQFVFSNDSATAQLQTLSLHDALPISWLVGKIHFFDCLPAREKFFKVGFFSKKARSYSPMNMGARGHFCDSKHKRYLGTKYRACHYRESMI